VRVCLQLKDAITRVILRECGYTGTYTSVLRRSYGPQPLDWIQPPPLLPTSAFESRYL
jgi:hypothetical protein